MSRVAFVKTEDRIKGVKTALKALAVNPVKGKNVLIKPNFNTADPVPGSTHNDTLMALVDETWAMGAKSISLGRTQMTRILRILYYFICICVDPF
jgi:uncharacterized protein (DUF362 family)